MREEEKRYQERDVYKAVPRCKAYNKVYVIVMISTGGCKYERQYENDNMFVRRN